VEILQEYLPQRSASNSRHLIKLVPIDNGSGDMWLPLPDKLLAELGWHAGEDLEVAITLDTMTLRRSAGPTGR